MKIPFGDFGCKNPPKKEARSTKQNRALEKDDLLYGFIS